MVKFPKIHPTLRSILLTLFSCLTGLAYSSFAHMSQIEAGAKYMPVSEVPLMPAPAGAPALDVLFVGSSFTIVNDLPGVFANIAASDQASPVKVRIGRFVQSGSWLFERWDDRQRGGPDPLAGEHWDYVVLQQSPSYYAIPEYMPRAVSGANEWIKGVSKIDAKPVLFSPWAYKEGDPYRAGGDLAYLRRYKTPDLMQDAIDKAVNAINTKAMVVPVGDHWMACLNAQGAPDLYMPDGMHPSIAGTYLTALVFYRRLTGHSLTHVAYVPPGLSRADAAFILNCASY